MKNKRVKLEKRLENKPRNQENIHKICDYDKSV